MEFAPSYLGYIFWNRYPNPKPIQRNKHLGISQRMDVEGSKLLTSEEIGLFHGDLSVDNDIENN